MLPENGTLDQSFLDFLNGDFSDDDDFDEKFEEKFGEKFEEEFLEDDFPFEEQFGYDGFEEVDRH